MRTALYARVSTKDKGQDTLNQLAQLRDFCDRAGWPVIAEYVDQASGKTSERPEFRKLFEAARRKEFECVLFWSLDRFSREGALETLQHLQKLTGYGVKWRSHTEAYLDSCGAFGDAVLAILACIAKQERIRIQERVVAGLARARSQGRVGGRPRVVCDREKVLDLHAAGQSLRAIAAATSVSFCTVRRIIAAAGVASTKTPPAPKPPAPSSKPSARPKPSTPKTFSPIASS